MCIVNSYLEITESSLSMDRLQLRVEAKFDGQLFSFDDYC